LLIIWVPTSILYLPLANSFINFWCEFLVLVVSASILRTLTPYFSSRILCSFSVPSPRSLIASSWHSGQTLLLTTLYPQ
jgi:hypothetical protein